MHGRDRQTEKKISRSWFSLTQHASPSSGCIQNLKTLAHIAGEKSVMDFYEKENKWANKENDKKDDADSLLHNTTSHTQCLS